MAQPVSSKGKKAAALTALVGPIAAGLLWHYTPVFEGDVRKGYRDPVGIVTACSGHTKTAVLGKLYSEEECKELLSGDLLEHAQGVLKCTPNIKERPYVLFAAIDFAFNEGVAAYCGSSSARRFKSGDWAGGCRALNESNEGKPQWVWATKPDGTRVKLPGLEKRRRIEREFCEERRTK